MSVTAGAIRCILDDKKNFSPVLQVTNIKGLTAAGQGAAQRYRLILTDGVDTIQAMLATQKNVLVTGGNIVLHSTLTCTEFMTNTLSNTKIMILLDCIPGPVIAQQQQQQQQQQPTPTPQQQQQQPQHQPAYGQQPYGQQQNQPPVVANAQYGQQQQQHHQQQQQQPTYGQHQQQQQQQQPAYGQHQQQQPAYGQPPAPAYGQPAAAAYGQPTASAYGQYQAPATSAYGQPPASAYNQGTGLNVPGAAGAYGGGGGASVYGGGSNSAPVSRQRGVSEVIPISALNPYSQAWTIKARVTEKSDIRRWSNERGEGTLFSIKLLDSSGGETKGTFFKEACDRFFGVLEEGKVYTMSGGKVKPANAKFNPTHDYEITFDTHSVIAPADDDGGIKQMSFRFCPIASLEAVAENSLVDVLAVVKSAEEPSEIVSVKMGGKTIAKRDITLVDQSGTEVRCTLWNSKATDPKYEWHTNPIIALKEAKVSSFSGRTLSANAISLNPDIPEAHELHKWKCQGLWQNAGTSVSSGGGGKGFSISPLIKRRSLDYIKVITHALCGGCETHHHHDTPPTPTPTLTPALIWNTPT
jgi:replication factor A1